DGSWGSVLDVNGDGYADVAVGANEAGSGMHVGAAYLYLGAAAGPATTAAWTQTGSGTDAYFGNVVHSAGDVNGDGFADLLSEGGGNTYVYAGGMGGPSATATSSVASPSASYFDSAGDVN